MPDPDQILDSDPQKRNPGGLQFPVELLQQCWFLAGPTAAGKSAVGLALAERLNAEILCLDSMTLYRGMDIGTAKPSVADQQRTPHHLLDVLDPHEEFTLAEYISLAKTTAEAVLARDRVPLFVGGTGLYLRGLLRGVFEGPPADWKLRQELEATANAEGAEFLHRQLTDCDPDSAAQLHPNDLRRVVRALEVYQLTGVPLSQHQKQKPLPEEVRPKRVYWLSPPRDWLYERINLRVEQMIAEGLREEVQTLLDQTPPLGRTARQGLGYKEMIAHVVGEQTLAATIELIQRRTRQFAKRQHTWFRNLVECHSMEYTGRETAEKLADRFLTDTEL